MLQGWRKKYNTESDCAWSSIIMTVQTIRVETPSAKYDVVAGSGLLETLAPRIERAVGRLPRRVFVLTSPEIWALWCCFWSQAKNTKPLKAWSG